MKHDTFSIMQRFAFISSVPPTEEQRALAAQHFIELISVGDRDAFSHKEWGEFSAFDGIIALDPWIILKASEYVTQVGVFEYVNKAVNAEITTLSPVALHLHTLPWGLAY